METLKKVVWAEGIFLGQQHFQQWDRNLENQQRLRLQLTTPFAWGLQHLVIDEEALLNGQFRIRSLRGIFSDGQLFSYDNVIEEPLSCIINSQAGEKIAIFLGLPINQQVTGITGYQHVKQSSTWKADYQTMIDLYDNNRQREVLFAKLNLMLFQNEEASENIQYLKIAEVNNDGRGGYKLIKNFIPTIVVIRASSHLQELLSRWIELISVLIRLLKEARRPLNSEVIDYAKNDLENFLLLHTLSRTLPALLHWQRHPDVHPQQLYLTISELVFTLSSYLDNFSPEQLPNYEHENLTETLNQLDKLLRAMLERVMPTRMASIKLRRESETLYLVDSIESAVFAKTSFFIAVFFQAQDAQWITQFARQIKVGSSQAIDSIVTSALPGVKATHLQRPPSKLSIKTGYEYFHLEPNGIFWEQIKTEKSMGIFVPFNFTTALIDLVTVQE